MSHIVGNAEETGWRGFLQPAFETRMKFPFSVLLTAAIWYTRHLDLWPDPTSDHYGDSALRTELGLLPLTFSGIELPYECIDIRTIAEFSQKPRAGLIYSVVKCFDDRSESMRIFKVTDLFCIIQDTASLTAACICENKVIYRYH